MNVVDALTASPRVQRKREARRKAILDAAIELIDELGLQGLTVQRLAAALDYTPGALYRYFASKDALVAALQRQAIDAIHDRLRADRDRREAISQAASERVAALAELLGIARGYVSLLETHPNHLHLVGLMLSDPRRLLDDDAAAQNAPAIAGLLAAVNQTFDRAASCGAIATGSARQRTVMYWSALQGVVQMGKMARFEHELFTPHTLGPELARTILIGWGADAEELATATNLLERNLDAPRTH